MGEHGREPPPQAEFVAGPRQGAARKQFGPKLHSYFFGLVFLFSEANFDNFLLF